MTELRMLSLTAVIAAKYGIDGASGWMGAMLVSAAANGRLCSDPARAQH